MGCFLYPEKILMHIEAVEGDEKIIPEIAEAIFAEAEENCIGNTCTLPATQHLQIRVI